VLVVIDAGNSNVVIGLYQGDTLLTHWRIMTAGYRTADEIRIQFGMLMHESGHDPKTVKGCCISSVVPQLNSALVQVARDGFKVEPVMVEPGIRTGIKLHNENPKELGADRLVNAVGAAEEYPGEKIILDFGTATTLDYITAANEYKGGIILAGIQLSANALFENCAKLPRVDVAVPERVIGRNTTDAISSGLTYGYAEMIDGLVRRMAREMGGEPRVIATGGLATTIAGVASTIDVVDPLLTLKGLKAIFYKNAKGAAA
jgi:type III pantothenate kinase